MRRGAAALIAAGAAIAASPACADPAMDAADTAARFPKNSDVASPGPAEQLKPAPPAPPVDPKALEPEPGVPDHLGESLLPGRKRPGMGQAPLPD